MALLNDITVKKERRICKVGEEFGYFHCWEQYGDVIFPGLMVGSNPGGQYSRVFGIVEFDDRVTRIEPSKIKFVDEVHDFLYAYSEMDARKEKMKVSEICKIVNDCDRLRNILLQNKHTLTGSEIQEICDILWEHLIVHEV